MYIEYASEFVANRNRIASEDTFSKIVKGAREKSLALFCSTLYYDETIIDHLSKFHTVRLFNGKYLPYHMIIDIDANDREDSVLLKHVKDIVSVVKNLGAPDNAIRIYFSGRGFHVYIHKNCFNFEASELLPYIYGQWVVDNIGHIVDESIYSSASLIRVPNTINEKSKLWKIPLSAEEFEVFDMDDIRKLAVSARTIDQPFEFTGDPIFDVTKYKRKVFASPDRNLVSGDGRYANRSVNTCLHNMYKEGPAKGQRHATVLTMAALMWRQGLPLDAATSVILDWLGNQPDMPKSKTIKDVRDTYKRGYTPSCDGNGNLSKIMQKYCDRSCRFYKDMQNSITIYTPDQAEQSFKEYAINGVPYLFDFAKFCGLPDLDCKFESGQVVTIMGPPGRGKSALVQNILCGLGFSSLYLSLEMGERQLFRRFQQINHGLSKNDVLSIYSRGEDLNSDAISSIDIVKDTLDFDKIRDIIIRRQYKILVVDHIKLLKVASQNQFHRELADYTNKFKSLTLNRDLLVIQVSQVGREYSRGLQGRDMHAASGSSGIEEGSDIMIGVWGDEHSKQRDVEIHKHREGDQFTQHFIHDGKTMRFEINNGYVEEEPKRKPVRTLPRIVRE